VVGAPASLTFYALWDQDHALDRYRRYGVPNGKRSDVWGRFDQDRIVRTRASRQHNDVSRDAFHHRHRHQGTALIC
jgi:hypothetical protein